EEFCLVSGLKFHVENSTDYNKAKDPIPFRRRVFSLDLNGRPIRGKDVGLLIESGVFKKLDDNDAVSLCCVGILQLVLLGVEDRRQAKHEKASDHEYILLPFMPSNSPLSLSTQSSDDKDVDDVPGK
nr:hypothetical protein [Tanacetum cinerariifolium]